MQNTTPVNGTKEQREPMAFRYSIARRALLEEIQRQRGHTDVSETIREALDEYVARWLRQEAA